MKYLLLCCIFYVIFVNISYTSADGAKKALIFRQFMTSKTKTGEKTMTAAPDIPDIPEVPEILELSSCNETFIIRNLEPNPISLGDGDLLLSNPSVAADTECAQKCCEDVHCCKAVYSQESGCFIYSYIKDKELPVPAGATVYEGKCCYDGEQVMGDVTLHMERKNADDAQTICENTNSTLAMPKTECAFKILEKMIEAKRAEAGTIIWIGVTNPTGGTFIFNDGDTPQAHGFELPRGPIEHEQEHEKQGMFYYTNGWAIGDWNGHETVSFLCQTNTS